MGADNLHMFGRRRNITIGAFMAQPNQPRSRHPMATYNSPMQSPWGESRIVIKMKVSVSAVAAQALYISPNSA